MFGEALRQQVEERLNFFETGAPPSKNADAIRKVLDQLALDDDDDEDKPKSDKKAGRRKIKIEFIQDKSRRHITFSKRKAGIMKKASPPVVFISLSSLLFFSLVPFQATATTISIYSLY